MHSDFGQADQKLSPHYSKLKKFSDLVLKIVDIQTDASPDKFSDVNAPFCKFIDVNAPLKIKVIKEIKGNDRAKVNPRFGKTKEYVAAEIKVLFPDLEDMNLFSKRQYSQSLTSVIKITFIAGMSSRVN